MVQETSDTSGEEDEVIMNVVLEVFQEKEGKKRSPPDPGKSAYGGGGGRNGH